MGSDTLLSSRHSTQILDTMREVQAIRSQKKIHKQYSNFGEGQINDDERTGVQLVDKKSPGKQQLVNEPRLCDPLKHCPDSLNFLQSHIDLTIV